MAPCGSSLRSLDILVSSILMSRMAHRTLTGVAPAMSHANSLLAAVKRKGQSSVPWQWFYRRVKVAPGSSHE